MTVWWGAFPYLSCFRTEISSPEVPSVGEQHPNRSSLVAAQWPRCLPRARAKNQQQLHDCWERAAPAPTKRSYKGLIAGLPLDQLLQRPQCQHQKTSRRGLRLTTTFWMVDIIFLYISIVSEGQEALLKLFCTYCNFYRFCTFLVLSEPLVLCCWKKVNCMWRIETPWLSKLDFFLTLAVSSLVWSVLSDAIILVLWALVEFLEMFF